jgi:hypothetical protein
MGFSTHRGFSHMGVFTHGGGFPRMGVVFHAWGGVFHTWEVSHSILSHPTRHTKKHCPKTIDPQESKLATCRRYLFSEWGHPTAVVLLRRVLAEIVLPEIVPPLHRRVLMLRAWCRRALHHHHRVRLAPPQIVCLLSPLSTRPSLLVFPGQSQNSNCMPCTQQSG